MTPSGFIAGRLRFRGNVAVISIAVSFFVMTIATAISSGFRRAVGDGLSSVSGDVRITPYTLNDTGGSAAVPSVLSFSDEILSMDGVAEIVPAVYRAGIVKCGDAIYGVMFKGTEDADSSLVVSVPHSLAEKTGLGPGDRMTAYFVGENVRARNFRVGGVYESMLDIGDNMIVRANLSDLRRLNGWDSTRVSALEIMLESGRHDRKTMDAVAEDAGARLLTSGDEAEQSLIATSARRLYAGLFDWLDLLDFNVLFIMILMTAVAGFNMISGLLILLFRNISVIGTLKTLGMTDRSISAVFVRMASVLALKGMAIGDGLALLFCLFQGLTHFIRLNPENYFVSFVPVHLDLPAVAAANAAAYAVIMLSVLLPTLFISKVDPAETVRVK